MGGKAALFLVIGFSLIFMVISRNISNISVRSMDNAMRYYEKTKAYSIALAGANITASKVFFDNNWDDGYDNISFNGGHYSVTVQKIDPARDIVKITSIGTFGVGNMVETHKVEVKLQPSSFSRFAYFSNKEKIGSTNIWWASKDTVWGPFHTNDKIRIAGNPVFMGKATSYKGIYKRSGSHPEFNGGYSQSAEKLPIPPDGVESVGDEARTNGLVFTGKDTVYMTFKNDSLTYKFGAGQPDTTVYLPSAAPNGTIYAEAANVRLKGVVDGRYTVAASEKVVTFTTGHWVWKRVRRRRWKRVWVTETTTAAKGGKIFLDDDIVYKDDPTQTYSDDILGIVAENEVLIADNAANASDINIQAAIYSQKKGFGAENFRTRPVSGKINLLGGITQDSRMAVGTFNSSGVVSGFSKRYHYDERLLLMSPPSFPGTGNFEVVSWFE
jgi:hypothetical protein